MQLLVKMVASAAFAALLATAAAVNAQGPPPLRVCADPNYMPYSDKSGNGFENKIAQVVGHAMGRPVVYVWGSTRGDAGFEEVVHQHLDAGRCDLLVNVPYGANGFKTTRPYYIASYVFVFKKRAGYDITSLDSPALRHVKIGYEADTPAEMGLKLRALTIGAKPFLAADDENASPSDLIDAVESGKVDVGITWDPAVGYYLQKHPDLTTVTLPNSRSQGSPEQYSFPMSMGVRDNDGALASELDRALASQKAQIATVLHSYNITFFQPGTEQ